MAQAASTFYLEAIVNDYDPLRDYLKKQTLPEFVLSFEQIEEIIDAFATRYEVSVETVSAVEESGIFFQLPRQVRSGEATE